MHLTVGNGMAVLLIIEVFILYTIGRSVNEYLAGQIMRGSGTKRMLLHTLFMPGVALHEASHAIVAMAVGGHVHKFVPYHPQVADDGSSIVFGYVSHSMQPQDPIRGFMVGIAPLIGVPALLLVLGSLLIPEASISDGPFGVFGLAVSQIFSTPLALLYVYLMVSGSLGLLPSASDHRDIIPFTVVLVGVVTAVVFLFPHADFGGLLVPSSFVAQLLVLPTVLSVSMYLLITRQSR